MKQLMVVCPAVGKKHTPSRAAQVLSRRVVRVKFSKHGDAKVWRCTNRIRFSERKWEGCRLRGHTQFGAKEWAESVNSSRYRHGICLDTQSGIQTSYE